MSDFNRDECTIHFVYMYISAKHSSASHSVCCSEHTLGSCSLHLGIVWYVANGVRLGWEVSCSLFCELFSVYPTVNLTPVALCPPGVHGSSNGTASSELTASDMPSSQSERKSAATQLSSVAVG